MNRILFVCLGNICRSPLAHGVAEHIVKTKKLELFIDSAGTGNWHAGEAPCDNSIKVAKQYNIDISQQYSQTDMEAFGFNNVYLLGDFGDFQGEDVPDPYFFDGFKGFEKVYNMISLCVEDFLEKVENETF